MTATALVEDKAELVKMLRAAGGKGCFVLLRQRSGY